MTAKNGSTYVATGRRYGRQTTTKVYLSIQNPLRMPDLATWKVPEVLKIVKEKVESEVAAIEKDGHSGKTPCGRTATMGSSTGISSRTRARIRGPSRSSPPKKTAASSAQQSQHLRDGGAASDPA